MPLLRRVKITESQLSFLLYFSMKKTQISLKMLQRLSGLQKYPKETEFYPYKNVCFDAHITIQARWRISWIRARQEKNI